MSFVSNSIHFNSVIKKHIRGAKQIRCNICEVELVSRRSLDVLLHLDGHLEPNGELYTEEQTRNMVVVRK